VLYGQTPWTARSEYELVKNIMLKPLTFPPFPEISQQIKDLIKDCLSIEESGRIAWNDIFKNDLFRGSFNEYL